jgi:hypothetical protein
MLTTGWWRGNVPLKLKLGIFTVKRNFEKSKSYPRGIREAKCMRL